MEAPQQQYPPEYLAEDRSRVLLNLVIAFIVLETTFFTLFMTARYMNRTLNGWDVYFMIPAYLAAMGHCIVAPIMIAKGGVGRHAVAVQPKTIENFLHLEVAEEYIYNFSIFFPKMSILFLYLRVFSTRNYRYLIYAIMVVVTLTCLSAQISASVFCHPFSYFWDKLIPGGHCANIAAAYRYISVPNLVTDVCILVLPLYGIWHLNLQTANKIGLSFTFLLGCVGIVTGICRLVMFFRIDLFKDVTYDGVQTMAWTLVEPGVYMIAATLPSMRPLVRYFFKEDTKFRSYLDRFTEALLSHRSSSHNHTKDNHTFDAAIKRETIITLQRGPKHGELAKMSERKESDDEHSVGMSSTDSSEFNLKDNKEEVPWTV